VPNGSASGVGGHSSSSGDVSSCVSSSFVSSGENTSCIKCNTRLFTTIGYPLCAEPQDGGLSSQQKWDALQKCSCSEGGVCANICANNYCVNLNGSAATSDCNNCIRASEGCSKYFDECAHDTKDNY